MQPDSTGNNWPGSKRERRPRRRVILPQGETLTLVITWRTTGPRICPPLHEDHKLGSAEDAEMLRVRRRLEGFVVENADMHRKRPHLEILHFNLFASLCNLRRFCRCNYLEEAWGLNVGFSFSLHQ